MKFRHVLFMSFLWLLLAFASSTVLGAATEKDPEGFSQILVDELRELRRTPPLAVEDVARVVKFLKSTAAISLGSNIMFALGNRVGLDTVTPVVHAIQDAEVLAKCILRAYQTIKSCGVVIVKGWAQTRHAALIEMIERDFYHMDSETRKNLVKELFYPLLKVANNLNLVCSIIGTDLAADDAHVDENTIKAYFKERFGAEKCSICLSTVIASIFDQVAEDNSDEVISSPNCDCKIFICGDCLELLRGKDLDTNCPQCRASIIFNVTSATQLHEALLSYESSAQ